MEQFICRLKFRLSASKPWKSSEIDWWNQWKLSLEVERPPTAFQHAQKRSETITVLSLSRSASHGILDSFHFYRVATTADNAKTTSDAFCVDFADCDKNISLFFSSSSQWRDFKHSDPRVSLSANNRMNVVLSVVEKLSPETWMNRSAKTNDGVYRELIDGNHWRRIAMCTRHQRADEMTWDLLVRVALTALFARILEHRKFLFSFVTRLTVMVQQTGYEGNKEAKFNSDRQNFVSC